MIENWIQAFYIIPRAHLQSFTKCLNCLQEYIIKINEMLHISCNAWLPRFAETYTPIYTCV